ARAESGAPEGGGAPERARGGGGKSTTFGRASPTTDTCGAPAAAKSRKKMHPPMDADNRKIESPVPPRQESGIRKLGCVATHHESGAVLATAVKRPRDIAAASRSSGATGRIAWRPVSPGSWIPDWDGRG